MGELEKYLYAILVRNVLDDWNVFMFRPLLSSSKTLTSVGF